MFHADQWGQALIRGLALSERVGGVGAVSSGRRCWLLGSATD
jgi:hypothetical protein